MPRTSVLTGAASGIGKATKELLEDELDIHDVYKIIEAASGIKLAGDDSGNPEAAELVGQS